MIILRKVGTSLWTHLGFIYFCAFSFASFLMLMREEVSGHYRIFTSAAKALSMGQTPYGSDFGTLLGYYFYSPSCGLYFFRAFSFFPEKVGLALYVLGSFALFLVSIRSCFKVFLGDSAWVPKKWGNWFWFFITTPMHGAIKAAKVEIVMVGVVLWAVSCLGSEKKTKLAAFLLAMILNWKFQPLPSVGLLSLTCLLFQRQLIFIPSLIVSFGFWYLLPLIELSPSFLWGLYQSQTTTLSIFINRDWLLFDHVFKLMKNLWAVDFSLKSANVISLMIGMLFCGFIASFVLKHKNLENKNKLWDLSLLLSTGLGAGFTCLFSPLNQNNGYIILTPLVFCLFYLISLSQGTLRCFMLVGVGCSWAVMTIPYSDLVSRSWRAEFRYLGVKPVGVIVMLTLATVCSWKLIKRIWLK